MLIDAARAVEGMEPGILAIRETLADVDKVLMDVFDVSPEELSSMREALRGDYLSLSNSLPARNQRN